jgi:hypothetical protein
LRGFLIHSSISVFFAQPVRATFDPVAILDSGCTLTVAGSTWISNFAVALSRLATKQEADDVFSIAYTPSMVKLCFGRDVRTAARCAILPAWIMGHFGHIRVQVIDDVPGEPQLPLLLSRPDMARSKVKIDYQSAEAEILGVR